MDILQGEGTATSSGCLGTNCLLGPGLKRGQRGLFLAYVLINLLGFLSALVFTVYVLRRFLREHTRLEAAKPRVRRVKVMIYFNMFAVVCSVLSLADPVPEDPWLAALWPDGVAYMLARVPETLWLIAIYVMVMSQRAVTRQLRHHSMISQRLSSIYARLFGLLSLLFLLMLPVSIANGFHALPLAEEAAVFLAERVLMFVLVLLSLAGGCMFARELTAVLKMSAGWDDKAQARHRVLITLQRTLRAAIALCVLLTATALFAAFGPRTVAAVIVYLWMLRCAGIGVSFMISAYVLGSFQRMRATERSKSYSTDNLSMPLLAELDSEGYDAAEADARVISGVYEPPESASLPGAGVELRLSIISTSSELDMELQKERAALESEELDDEGGTVVRM
eukprot:PLAT12991.1.p1 GENE.PLAT12991.1~~PLAT12991.1.p1  ORF type:complete len:394 (+),score=144.79 PLAT12991.1:1-1182(+)